VIDVVLFDLYETLVTESGLRPTRASSLASTLGLEERAYRSEWRTLRPRITRGEISFAQALTDISRTLGGRVDPDVVSGICEQRRREKAAAYARIDGEVATLMKTLSALGIRLAVVSNGFSEDVAGWPKCSLAPYFECAAFSCVERVAKPDRDIYVRALQRLGAEPSRAAYIGDGADDELGGAERVGLKAGRAGWFVRNVAPSGTRQELTSPKGVLKFIAAG